MNILWLINIPLPEIAQKMKIPKANGGGWIEGMIEALDKYKQIKLSIVFPNDGNNAEYNRLKIGNKNCYGFFKSNKNTWDYDPHIENQFIKILKEVQPDIIHIFGTEYPHSLSMVKACEKMGLLHRTLLQIQGLVSIYAKHYYANLPEDVIKRYTIRDLLRGDNIKRQKEKFEKRGKFEIQALEKANFVIGRTDWDAACVKRINSEIFYLKCNETLRAEFYRHNWSLDACKRHSIFVSQSSYPIKGFHLMLEAMKDIIKVYPDAHLYTTGVNPLQEKSLKKKIKVSSYQYYLEELIERYCWTEHITFLGSLNEKEMCKKYLESHVFVSCSSIENSSNSVGEAMLLGIPTVSSDVGGIKNLLIHEKEGYIYPYDEPYMLAYYIMKLFSNDTLCREFSVNAKIHAKKTHDVLKNAQDLLNIYKIVMKGTSE